VRLTGLYGEATATRKWHLWPISDDLEFCNLSRRSRGLFSRGSKAMRGRWEASCSNPRWPSSGWSCGPQRRHGPSKCRSFSWRGRRSRGFHCPTSTRSSRILPSGARAWRSTTTTRPASSWSKAMTSSRSRYRPTATSSPRSRRNW